MSQRFRNFVFTLNNYTPEEVEVLNRNSTDGIYRYLLYGKEVGENGTPHLQGMVCFKDGKTFASAKRLLCDRVHIERMRGTFSQASDYCRKDGDVVEHGELPLDQTEKGKKTKDFWENLRAAAVAGDLENVDPQSYIKYYPTLQRIRKDHLQLPDDLDDTCGVWIYGSSGIGKSRYARYHWPHFFYKMPNKWWEGYQNQENVLVDDLDPDHAYLAYFLKIWTDRYAFSGEIKGSALMIRPQKVIITSQYVPEQIFKPEDAKAIRRRCQVIHLVMPWTPPIHPPMNPSSPVVSEESQENIDVEFLA